MDHEDWVRAAGEEHHRWQVLLADLSEADWAAPTDCREWDVRQVVAHMVGASEAATSMREQARQVRRGRRLRPGATTVDAMNAVQVLERAGATPADLRRDLRLAGERALRARAGLPGPVRAIPVPFGPPLGVRTLGYLTDRVLTRDAWMHRIDVARATGRPLQVTGMHDGRLVADVVREWATTHGRPCRLHLTGPAGGRWVWGSGGADLRLDAVEFCRALSGRGPAEGLLRHHVPF